MAKCIIIGGGLAGISAAVHLNKAGHKVTLLEATNKLGGRSYSFYDKVNRSEIDNGQHIMMGAYEHTFKLLKIINADSIPYYQSKLSVEFKRKGGETFFLKSPNKLYPFNLVIALLKYHALTLTEKINALRLIASLLFLRKSKGDNNKKVSEWFKEQGQNENLIKSLWEVIAVGALNTKLPEASASVLKNLLLEIFLKGNQSATIVLPKVPLSKLFIEPAVEYFKLNSIDYSFSERVLEINVTNSNIDKLVTNKREITKFDKVIFAVPPHSLKHILKNEYINNEITKMDYSSIITIHLWSEQEIILNKFVGFIDSKIHWIFKNKDHYSIVISAADEFIKLTSAEIFELCRNELKSCIPKFNPTRVSNYKVIKEKRATIKCTPENEMIRKLQYSNLKNVCFAGDWVNTGLPGTIEGAILSGETVIISE